MAIRIRGSTIASLLAQRELNNATDSVARLTERLASGLRINRVGDDPAGLALADSLNADARVLGQGRRNVNDAISLLNIADAATGEISNLLTRMQELAEQAANGTLSSAQREALDKEYQALSQEVQRITNTTEFNGINLLEGQSRTHTFTQATNTTGAGYTNQLALTADGSEAIVYSSTDGQFQYVDLDTGDVTVIATATLGITLGSKIVTDATGDIVAFISTSDLTGQNAGGQNQIFVYDRRTDSITQITDSQGGEIFYGFNMSADGSTIAFTSQTTYGSGTPTYTVNQNLYLYDLASGNYTDTQIQAGTVVTAVGLSANGNFVSYYGTQNPFGLNADGNGEVFLFEAADPMGTLRQITQSTGFEPAYFAPLVTNNGDVFLSSVLDHVGSNPSGGGNIFKYTYAEDNLTQITSNNLAIQYPFFLQNDGTKIHIFGVTDPATGVGTSQAAVFSYDIASGSWEQTSQFDQTILSTSMWAISSDGTRLVEIGTGDPFGTNGDGSSELFIGDITNDDTNITISTGQGAGSEIEIDLASLQDRLRGLGGFIISSEFTAPGTLRAISETLQNLNIVRGEIGASLSRMEYAVRHIENQETQYRAAESRIRDADVASTVSELIAAQIKQELASFVLAQANQEPELVLLLLGNKSS